MIGHQQVGGGGGHFRYVAAEIVRLQSGKTIGHAPGLWLHAPSGHGAGYVSGMGRTRAGVYYCPRIPLHHPSGQFAVRSFDRTTIPEGHFAGNGGTVSAQIQAERTSLPQLIGAGGSRRAGIEISGIVNRVSVFVKLFQ